MSLLQILCMHDLGTHFEQYVDNSDLLRLRLVCKTLYQRWPTEYMKEKIRLPRLELLHATLFRVIPSLVSWPIPSVDDIKEWLIVLLQRIPVAFVEEELPVYLSDDRFWGYVPFHYTAHNFNVGDCALWLNFPTRPEAETIWPLSISIIGDGYDWTSDSAEHLCSQHVLNYFDTRNLGRCLFHQAKNLLNDTDEISLQFLLTEIDQGGTL